ncbi:hydrolase pyvD-like, partial [Nicotiana sylvestris]|uniref:hydrolase pyvD-like n=1 Tax=Nicotiana sylvestris TaxID=4096 RepID=UPI00388CA166
KGCEDAKAVVESLKSKGVSAVGAADKYRDSGMVVSKLAKYESSIGAALILHPGPITVDEINEAKVPTAILAAEHDHIFPPDQAKQLGDALSAKSEIESFVKIFPGVQHGWTVRYNVEDELAVKAAEESHSDMLNWFIK